MAVTRDLDMSMADFVQFVFQYGCHDVEDSAWQPHDSVLLQYSNNGGIWWNLLEEIYYRSDGQPRSVFSVGSCCPECIRVMVVLVVIENQK